MKLDDLDAIAYTRGPGMKGCLTICSTAAKAIGAISGKPVIGVHHMVCPLRLTNLAVLSLTVPGSCVPFLAPRRLSVARSTSLARNQ